MTDQSVASSADSSTDPSAKAKTGAVWLASTTIVSQIFSWVLTLLTARLLSPADYGLLALFEAIFPYLLMLTTFKLDVWLLQEHPFTKEKESTASSISIAFGALSTIAALTAAPYVARYYNTPELLLPLQLSSIIFVLRGFQLIPETRIRRNMEFKSFGILNALVSMGRGVLQLTLAFLGFRYWALVIGGIVREVVYLFGIIRLSGLPARAKIEKVTAKRALLFGASATSAAFFWVLFSTADNIIIGKILGVQVLGLYAMAFFLIEMPISKIASVINPILPSLYGQLKLDLPKLRQTYLDVTAAIMILVAPTLIGIMVGADEITSIFLGDRWAGLPAMLRPLCAIGILRLLVSNTHPLVYALGRPGYIARVTAVTAVVLPISFWFAAQAAGISGVILVWFVVFPLVGILPVLNLLSRVADISILASIKSIAPGALSSIVMGIGVHFGATAVAFSNPLASLVLKVLLGVLIYPISLALLFRSDTVRIVSFLNEHTALRRIFGRFQGWLR